MLTFNATPKGAEFIANRDFVKGIMGPVGSGKSTMALFDLLSRAMHQEPFKGVRRTRFGLLRNTVAQLRSTVKPLVETWFITMMDGTLGKWTQTQGTLTFEMRVALPDGTSLEADFMLLAADTPEDVRRLLSLELSAAWVEEAREVDPEVFAGLQGRVNRFPSRAAGGVTYPGVTFSTNPPPLGGFWHELISRPPSNASVFIQPPAVLHDGSINPEAENLANLAPDYYENLLEGKTEEWINVYLRNQFGQGNAGKPVFKSSFKPSFHVSKTPLQAVPQSVNPLVIGMDNGLQAAAAMMQQDMRGRINVLSECYVPEDTTMGVESFLDRLLIPHLRAAYPQFRPENILFVLDPACFQRSQVNEATIAQAVQKRGYRALSAVTNDPEKRIDAAEGLLTRQVDGQAGLLIDPKCTYLIEGLEWGYRFKNTTTGNLSFDKTHHSHLAEGWVYGCTHFNPPVLKAIGQTRRREVKKSPYVYALGA